MTTSPATTRLRHYLRNSWRVLAKEISAFGLVGSIAFIMDIAIFSWLTPQGALKAKTISTAVSTTFAYFGNRHLSFSHRARTSLKRETAFFFGINLITLTFSLLVIAIFVYPLHYAHGSFTVKLVNVATIVAGTGFRFWSYKRFVFLHPDRVHAGDVDLDEELGE